MNPARLTYMESRKAQLKHFSLNHFPAMRLLHLDLDKRTWIVESFSPTRIPFYAILLHTWRRENDEVKFEDIESGER
jgi:hypothetical protein